MAHPLPQLRALLELGVDVDSLDEHQATPLHVAVRAYADPLPSYAQSRCKVWAGVSPVPVQCARCHTCTVAGRCWVTDAIRWQHTHGARTQAV